MGVGVDGLGQNSEVDGMSGGGSIAALTFVGDDRHGRAAQAGGLPSVGSGPGVRGSQLLGQARLCSMEVRGWRLN